MPGRALVRLHAFDEAALLKASSDARVASQLGRLLDEVAARTGVRLSLVRPMSFGWALYDIADDTAPALRPDEEKTLELVTAVSHDKAVAGASEDGWRRPLRVPNDEFYSYMWHLESIRAPAAWDVTTGLTSQRIGVIDTGTVRNHIDLSAKDLAGYDFISEPFQGNDGNGRDADYSDPGDSGDCGDGFVRPDSWHGTHVAGTILASTNEGVGIAGVNWNAQLVTARVLGVCGGADSDILESMAWLSGYTVDGVPGIGANAVSVINMSLGGQGVCHEAYQYYFETIIAQVGVVFVAASGNDGNHIPVGVPANCEGAIAVGAHGPGSNRPLTDYTQFGPELAVIAPGGVAQGLDDPNGVLSAFGPDADLYAFYQGTSMASPHVAGIVSLMLAANPQLSPAQVKSILIQTGEACSGCGNVPAVRADLAVQAAQNTTGIGGGGGGGGGGGLVFGVGPCPSDGVCPSGQICLGQTIETGRCYLECTSASQCGAGTQCFDVGGGTAVCLPAGDLVEGDTCNEADPFHCNEGTVCLTDGAASQCYARCDMGYACPSSSQTCVQIDGLAYCDPIGGGGGGGGGGGCDLRRGNWDCPNGAGCVDDGNGDDTGFCQEGADGRTKSGGLCDDADDCASGLCDRGVCTVPCDEDGECRDGYECEDDAIPGGLCRPESCADSRGAICEDDWYCTYSEAERYVCALEGEPAFGRLCACVGVPKGAPWGALALLGLFVLGRRRRR